LWHLIVEVTGAKDDEYFEFVSFYVVEHVVFSNDFFLYPFVEVVIY
jgi:hypothetical protein